jgi:hypothetical protein
LETFELSCWNFERGFDLLPTAITAIDKIKALRRYPVPATEKAVQRIIASLGLQDLIDVTLALAALESEGK